MSKWERRLLPDVSCRPGEQLQSWTLPFKWRHLASFPITSVIFNIRRSASWSFRTVNQYPLRYGLKSRRLYGKRDIPHALCRLPAQPCWTFLTSSHELCCALRILFQLIAPTLLVTRVVVKRIASVTDWLIYYRRWQRSMLYRFQCSNFGLVQSSRLKRLVLSHLQFNIAGLRAKFCANRQDTMQRPRYELGLVTLGFFVVSEWSRFLSLICQVGQGYWRDPSSQHGFSRRSTSSTSIVCRLSTSFQLRL